MQRINVVGSSGSGKSTFAKRLSSTLEIPHIEMDRLYWKSYWQESNDKEFIDKLRSVLSQDSWVLDGNYSRTAPVKWQRADTVIWLDYSFTRTLYQALKRAFIRCYTKQELWGKEGTFETFRRSFFSKDSVVLWMITNHATIRERYLQVFEQQAYPKITFVQLKKPKEAEAFLRQASLKG